MQMSENDICLNCITLSVLVDFLQKHIIHTFCGVRNNYSYFKLMFFVLWSHNLVPRTFSLFKKGKRSWERGWRSCLPSSPLSKQLPTRVDSLFFKKRREKRMQIFSNWHEDRGMEVISSLFFQRQGRWNNLQSTICSVSEAQIMQISHQQNIWR